MVATALCIVEDVRRQRAGLTLIWKGKVPPNLTATCRYSFPTRFEAAAGLVWPVSFSKFSAH
jgi:hypothetical protein